MGLDHVRVPSLAVVEHAHVRLRGQHFQGVVVVAAGEQHFDELPHERFGQLAIDVAIQRDHPAER